MLSSMKNIPSSSIWTLCLFKGDCLRPFLLDGLHWSIPSFIGVYPVLPVFPTMLLLDLTVLLSVASALPFSHKAKPFDQEALDQFNILRFLGTASPYVQQPGHGIDTKVPYGCEVTQVNFISRHGERYPTASKGKSISTALERVGSANMTSKKLDGPLWFLPSYTFDALDSSRYDEETSTGPYSGLSDMYAFGETFRTNYKHLISDEDLLKFYVASEKRVVDSARKFAEGFLGKPVHNSSLVIIDEDDETLGANSLTPVTSCSNYNSTFNDALINSLSESYLEQAATRLNNETSGLNLKKKEVAALMDYCGFDLNVSGKSAICDIFTSDELLSRAYANDVGYYYHKGPGYNLSIPIGSVFVNAMIEVMKDDSKNLTMSFAHDTDIFFIVSMLGLYDGELSLKHQDLNALWKVSNINPMGSRLLFERLQCNSNQTYVRIIHNDAVLPITSISSGPGFSSSLDDFEEYIQKRLNGETYSEACGNPSGMAEELTFFWD